MQTLGLNEIREKYLRFFESKQHLRADSFPLVPQGDASLLLINSGMAPLKPYFSGEVTPPARRMTTCQKCIRTPDIENVGKTSRHGTFFEMLGNFSFGDYFKKEAIAWAWEFCTEVMELLADKLYPSVYLEDDEAWDIWVKDVGVDESRMTRLGKKDNFWEIGSGPCGPCSEIYFDRGEQYGCGSPDCKVGCDCDRYVEFWNLVFTQFHNDGQGNYSPLKQKNIDTGMGLERLACIMQGVGNLFEVDTIQNIMTHIAQIAGVIYKQNEKTDVSLRVITDHIRSTTMMICDGVLPSNEGRGYVLRRLLRRAARHGKLLGISEPFLYKVCETVIRESGQAYPALVEKSEHIRRVVRLEEERFAQTLEAGLKLLRDTIETLRTARETAFPAVDAFRLYDTFGFPVDMTQEMLAEQALTLDLAGFEELMGAQRTRARQARAAMGDLGWNNVDLGLDRSLRTVFTGYETLQDNGKILCIVAGELIQSAEEGARVAVVLDKTPFYAESGGQVADNGILSTEGGVLRVDSVQKTPDGKILHAGEIISGSLSVGDTAEAAVDPDRRQAIRRAHSATHLLHTALRETLGEHVTQAGSLVEPDRLRFDFSHMTAVTPEELSRVARRVNEMALAAYPVTATEMPQGEARKLGAMALFSEKYGDTVRVVRMGGVSLELCGGTHLDNTAQIGAFAVTSEASVAAGVRRIEAHVGLQLVDDMAMLSTIVAQTAAHLKAVPGELALRAGQLLLDLKNAHREVEKLKQKDFKSEAEQFLLSARQVAGLRVVTAIRPGLDADALRAAGDFLRDRDPDVVAVMATAQEDKVTFFACCGKNAVARGLRAGDIIREVTRVAGGSGGGKPDSAMGGGKDVSKMDDALAIVDDFVVKNAK